MWIKACIVPLKQLFRAHMQKFKLQLNSVFYSLLEKTETSEKKYSGLFLANTTKSRYTEESCFNKWS